MLTERQGRAVRGADTWVLWSDEYTHCLGEGRGFPPQQWQHTRLHNAAPISATRGRKIKFRQHRDAQVGTLTGLKTSIRQSKCTASWVACVERVYRAAMEGGLWPCRKMWALAPSHAVFMSSKLGVPRSSTIKSSCKTNANIVQWEKVNCPHFECCSPHTQVCCNCPEWGPVERQIFLVSSVAKLENTAQICHFSSSDICVCLRLRMRVTCWIGLCAWKRILLLSSSAKIQPTDQISTADV